MDQLLPAVAYQSPPRPGRGTILNTIMEEQREGSSGSSNHGSGTDTDEGTVIYNPITTGSAAEGKTSTLAGPRILPSNPTSSIAIRRERYQQRRSMDDLYDNSDNETEFSDSFSSIRDSVSSRPTSFATDSTRSSIASCRSSARNRYPAIMIPPSNTWPSLIAPIKSSPSVPPTPPPKIPVSPAALSLLPRFVPAINAPPSLDGSSMTSEQVSCISAPVTPDMHNLTTAGNWDGQHHVHLRRDPDSAVGDAESEGFSPQPEILIEQAINWDEVGLFPRIPGASSHVESPTAPDIHGLGVSSPTSSPDQGVLLPAEALQTLSHLAPVQSYELRSDSPYGGPAEMCESAIPKRRPHSLEGATPGSSASDYSYSQLSIPSPGGFFSSLKTNSRHTWYPSSSNQKYIPSSATAENFYNRPWEEPQNIVEQVIETDDAHTEGPPTARNLTSEEPVTARRIPLSDPIVNSEDANDLPESISSGIAAVEEALRISHLPHGYEETYETELISNATAHLDRTSTWLAAQDSYLSALRETNPANDLSKPFGADRGSMQEMRDQPESPVKKIVRFLEQSKPIKAENDDKRGSQIGDHKEHIYYHAFQHLENQRTRYDSFRRGTSRYDALQASRIALMDEHLDQLRGKYEVREPTRPKYSGPFSQNPRATGLDYTPAQMAFMEVEREKGVLDQVSASYWAVDALKYLNGGSLLLSNASKRLAKAEKPVSNPKSLVQKRVRALDLGGNPSCDWAWHCARQFPNVDTYTVVTASATTNTSVTGPKNHRLLVAPQLWRLPFPNDHFDLISARSLHALLKKEPVAGQSEIDEYDLCLSECYRVLKPGGYLEFLVMDSDMTRPGPLGNALSVEFGYKLKTRGYDPQPTKPFLQRLRNAHLVNIKRAWMFLPAGSPTQDTRLPRETPMPIPPSAHGAEAVQGPVGSTLDVANVTGLLGSWMWEQWMLKLQTETGVEKEKLLKGMAPVFEEARNCGAGWKCLSGWARKPSPKRQSKKKTATKKKKQQQQRTAGTSQNAAVPAMKQVDGPAKPEMGVRHARIPTTETIHIKIDGLDDQGQSWF